MDTELIYILGDKRFKCIVKALKGGECELLKIDKDKLFVCDQEEVEKVYKFLPEFNVLRQQGYDIVCKLVELVNRLRSENVTDLVTAVAMVINVLFGYKISEEDAKKIGEAVKIVECVSVSKDGIDVDNECLSRLDVPKQLKDQVRMISLMNLVW